MDEFRRQLEQLSERIRDWVSDITSRLGGAARDARAAAAERRARNAAAEASTRELTGDSALVIATADDDVASVVGRIDTAESPEVMLVVRRDAKALRQPSAWPHIAAYVRRRGIELGVVAPRADVRNHAKVNGLRAARSPGGLHPQVEYLDIMGRRVVVPPVPWGRIVRGSMIIVALSTVTFLACYRVPSATITIVPPSEVATATGSARANALTDNNDLDGQVILATTVRRQVFTAVTTTTSGEVEVGDTHAILTVTFQNAAGNVVRVPRGTRLVSEESIAFVTDEDLDVPAQDSASVGATAEFPGEPGNLAAGSLATIEGDVPPEVTIAGSTAGSGGTNRLTAAVAQADVDRVRDIADDVLDGIALGTLEQLVEEEGGTLLPSSVSAAIFSERPLQQLEEPADIFVVEYTITASGLVVSDADASAYGELLIRDQLPDGVALIPGSVTATLEPQGDRGEVLINATGRTATLTDIAVAANQVTGMRPDEARNLLQDELDLDDPPAIEISPNFIPWLWLPRRAESIEVIIGTPQEEQSEDAEGADGEGGEGGEEGEGDEETATVTVTPADQAAGE